MGHANYLRHLPNLLTSSRILATPIIGYAVYKSNYQLGFPLFVWCGSTDLLDGYLARRFKWNSKLGSLLDPLADKILVGSLTVAFTASGSILPSTGLLILGRDAGLLLSSCFLSWRHKIPLSNIEVQPFLSSKINTSLQLLLLGLCLWEGYKNLEKEDCKKVKKPLERIVQGTTIFSGVSYLLWHRKAFKII